MTTILVDIKNKTMYSDSRTTSERTYDGNITITYFQESNKLFEHPNKNMIAATFGCVGISYNILKRLGFNIPSHSCGIQLDDINTKGQSGGVLIMNKHNNTVKHIGKDINNLGVTTQSWNRWLTGGTHITAGSGGKVADKVYSKIREPLKAMRFAGLIDKYSNTNIKQINI